MLVNQNPSWARKTSLQAAEPDIIIGGKKPGREPYPRFSHVITAVISDSEHLWVVLKYTGSSVHIGTSLEY
jgi:hypothetical protein